MLYNYWLNKWMDASTNQWKIQASGAHAQRSTWQVASRSQGAVVSTRWDPLKNCWGRDQDVHIDIVAQRASVNHGPRIWAGLGLWMRNLWAWQLGTAANGGRADMVMKKTKRQGPYSNHVHIQPFSKTISKKILDNNKCSAEGWNREGAREHYHLLHSLLISCY